MTLFKTLIQPDHDENQERAEISNAANLLQIGEFQLLQLAFHDWHERDMPQVMIDPTFTRYMLHDEVPFWARQYARKILELDRVGALDDNQPHYHRYDADYHTHVPDGAKKFIWAAMFLVIAIFGSILLANSITGSGGSIFPPYFDTDDLKRNPGR